MEKSGSGTGEIIRLCREAGLADPQFESMTGHFKTIIWRRGYGGDVFEGPEKAQKGPRKSEAQKRKGPEMNEGQKEQRTKRRGPFEIIQAFSDGEDLSMSMIAKGLGSVSASGYLKRAVATMCADGILMPTRPAKARNRFQKYRLTAKGKLLAARLAKKRKAAK